MRSRPLHDLQGRRFTRLTVVGFSHFKDGAYWNCICKCGTTVKAPAKGLLTKSSKSCGCLQKDKARKLLRKQNHKHGGSGTRLHNIWCGMKQRCYYPRNKFYKEYGGRGIQVCEEWRTSFLAFRRWAKGNGYRWYLTIDRQDNEKGYEPTNCRWITNAEQQKNKRKRDPFVDGMKATYMAYQPGVKDEREGKRYSGEPGPDVPF